MFSQRLVCYDASLNPAYIRQRELNLTSHPESSDITHYSLQRMARACIISTESVISSSVSSAMTLRLGIITLAYSLYSHNVYNVCMRALCAVDDQLIEYHIPGDSYFSRTLEVCEFKYQ